MSFSSPKISIRAVGLTNSTEVSDWFNCLITAMQGSNPVTTGLDKYASYANLGLQAPSMMTGLISFPIFSLIFVSKSILVSTPNPSSFKASVTHWGVFYLFIHHIENSYSIWLGGLPVFGGYLIERETPIYLVLEKADELNTDMFSFPLEKKVFF